jgi:hypothetical protein
MMIRVVMLFMLIQAVTFGDGYCTGVVIAQNRVLTAAHCVIDLPREMYSKKVEPQTSKRASLPVGHPAAVAIKFAKGGISVKFANGKTASGELLAKGHPIHTDAAVISVLTQGITPVEIASDMPYALPTGCLFSGIGGNLQLKTMPCALRPGAGPAGLRTISADGLPGDSGGPVIGRNGQLVGIISRISSDSAEIYVEPYYRLTLFLKEHL